MYQTGFLLLFTKKDVSAVRTKMNYTVFGRYFQCFTQSIGKILRTDPLEVTNISFVSAFNKPFSE